MAEGRGSLTWFSIRATRMLSLDITHHTTQWVWLLVDVVPRYALFRVPVDQHQQKQFSFIRFCFAWCICIFLSHSPGRDPSPILLRAMIPQLRLPNCGTCIPNVSWDVPSDKGKVAV